MSPCDALGTMSRSRSPGALVCPPAAGQTKQARASAGAGHGLCRRGLAGTRGPRGRATARTRSSAPWGSRTAAVVADLGCGTGLLRATHGAGRGPARDASTASTSSPRCSTCMKRAARPRGHHQRGAGAGQEPTTRAPPASLDWILLVDVYHEFQQPKPMLAKMREASRPTGRIALVEYRLEGDSAAHIRPEHRMSVEQVLARVAARGLPAGEEARVPPHPALLRLRQGGVKGANRRFLSGPSTRS